MGAADKLLEFLAATATVNEQLTRLRADLEKIENRVEIIGETVSALQLRVTRLEDGRDLDRARMATEVERYKLLVERFELHLRQLPPPTN